MTRRRRGRSDYRRSSGASSGRGSGIVGAFARLMDKVIGFIAGIPESTKEASDRWLATVDSAALPSRRRVLGYPLIAFAALSVGYAARLVWLQVIKSEELSADAAAERTVTTTLHARRGTIYDRNGVVLAASLDAKNVYTYPAQVEDAKETARAIAAITGGDADDYYEILNQDSWNYLCLATRIDVEAGDAIEELDITGIYLEDDTRREYPYGQVAGQIIGSTQYDEGSWVGDNGLELFYEDVLSGENGYRTMEYDMYYSTGISGTTTEYVEAVDGADVVLSIDVVLQEYVEERLAEGLESLGASDGSAIVMDAATGEIYAACSLPLFNPADRSVVEEGATVVKGITQAVEPGSVFKSVSALAILEDGQMDDDTAIYCPSSLTVSGYTITDSHDRDDCTYTLRQVLAYSSNVGIARAVNEVMGVEKLYDAIDRYQITECTGVDYPGEAQGTFVEYDSSSWAKVNGYTVSFGQGVSVTPLEVARFYCMVSNGGVQHTPHFAIASTGSAVEVADGSEQIVEDADALDTLVSMLGSVVEYGTGTAAAIDGYTVAGKTSTAQIYDSENGGYLSNVYYLAFCGFLPGSSSSLVCFVGANEVSGGGVVTPIFKDIMQYCIDLYDITS